MSAASDVLSAAVTGLTVQTSLSPDINISNPFGTTQSSSSGLAGVLANVVRPQVVISTALGPVTVAPFGAPLPILPVLVVLGVVGAGLAIYGLYALTK